MNDNGIIDELNSQDEALPLVKLSVRSMVEFLLRNGDIDNRHRAVSDTAMQEGSRIHRMIQRRMGAGYRAEVSLSFKIKLKDFNFVLEGRADGIFEKEYNDLTVTVIDEIKGVYQDLRRLKEPKSLHLAQAKCYAAMLLLKEEKEQIGVQMTYCNIDTEEIKRFEEWYTKDELLSWFFALVHEYEKWASFRYDWRRIRQNSIKALEFPYEYREGQKELAAQVYYTIYHKKRLFLEAPTGVGKTISTLFPSIKALGENKSEIIFYLTAKTLTGVVAEETFDILRENGLSMKTVRITAKDKLCPLGEDERECNPEVCPYAKGHYDRINDCMFELLNTEDAFTREVIIKWSEDYMVCPFELCLDMSLFADGIICDYNYVFDPDVRLKRFFGEGVNGDYIFLVDEAHNLIDRAREMYSASLYKEDFLELKRVVAPFAPSLGRSLNSCNKLLLDFKRNSVGCTLVNNIDSFIIALTHLASKLDEFLEEDEGSNIRKQVLDFYFEVRHFLNMAELISEKYLIYTMLTENDRFMLSLMCVNPSDNLRNCLDRGTATIFFSATLLPVRYYMELLSGDCSDYAVYAKSSFASEQRGVFIAQDVTSRYKRRTPEEYGRIASYIYDTIHIKKGNYMVFFPSYSFLQAVYEVYLERYIDESEGKVICQSQQMNEEERELFLHAFGEDENVTGFCVLGGVFSEGIDLKEDSLIGAIVVGTGLPQVSPQLELIKNYFDRERRGFEYAYRIPGMNKVLQSAGRVIRTAKDKGIILLLDDRFAENDYKSMYPLEWENVYIGRHEGIIAKIKEFWQKMGEE